MPHIDLPCVCGATEVGESIVRGRSRAGEAVDIRPCVQCGLARTYPPPRVERLNETVYQSEAGFADQVRDYSRFRGYAKRILSIIEARLGAGAGRTLLDVGCGIGALVAEAVDRGYAASGIDINDQATRYGRDTLGLPLHTGAVEALHESTMRYDLIVLSQVLEHLEAPAAALNDLSRLLKPGGHIAIESPNMAGLYPRILRAWWYPYGVSQHLWHFTPKTIGGVARAARLRLTFTAARRCVDYRQPEILTPLVDLPGTLLNLGDNFIAVFQS